MINASPLATCTVMANFSYRETGLCLERFPHLPVPLGRPNHGIIYSRRLIEGAGHVEGQTMLVDGKGTKLRIHGLACRCERFLERPSLGDRHFGHAIERRDKIAR